MLNAGTGTRPHLQRFFDELSRALKSALLLDYDGTLSPFRLHRGEAIPYPGVTMLLTEIMNTGHTRVVVISGRPAREIIPLLGVAPHPEIWGVHGLQRLNPDGSCEMPGLDESSVQALAEAALWLDGIDLQDLAEHKPGCLAVHWRGLSPVEQSEIRRIVLSGWMPIAHRARMTVQDFDGGLEMRPAHRNKGDAVRSVLSELAPDTPVAYLGDDQTDEDAFRALSERGLRVLVRPEWKETAADVWLRPPGELQVFLCDWLEACQAARRCRLSQAS
jgi:trehalose 6-phosphate phosphatase